tara:strand:+ start:330 stop:767 length:438 start_codon:yes stop_codon:yes gene_type:complete
MIVYRTENKINNKFYYGVDTKDRSWYYGSGIALKRAIKKYGIDNFVKRTICRFNTKEDAFNFESILVDNTMINNSQCYNMKEGGYGGWSHIPNTHWIGVPKSKEWKKSMSKLMRKKQSIVTCPHCKKQGGASNMTRYHFDSCKHR